MTTYETAVDTIYGVFKTAWDNGASPIIGYDPDVEYDEPITDNPAPLDVAFARLSVRNVNEGQITLGSPQEAGAHEYGTLGLLVVQIFMPKASKSGATIGRRLSTLVRDAYRRAGVNGEVEFFNATIREQPPTDRWRQFNVNVEYTFIETT